MTKPVYSSADQADNSGEPLEELLTARLRAANNGSRSSDAPDDLVDQVLSEANEYEAIRDKLIEAEKNGFTDQSPAEILKEIQNGLGRTR